MITKLVRYSLAPKALFLVMLFLLIAAGDVLAKSTKPKAPAPPKYPNILFIIMDDVGIDKMQIFGYGGAIPPQTPSINAIAQAGVRFKNAWAMPECSPSRALFFQGRFPFRTNILGAIGPLDLANSHVSPYETTTPVLLKQRNYTSGLFGKFHLGGPENNPYENETPRALGWDYFYGYIGGLPASVDSTAGGVATPGTYSCGFVNDAITGACYFADSRTCNDSLSGVTAGRTCMEEGGIFVPNQQCQSTPPSNLDFNTLNAFYVSPLVINHENGVVEEINPTDPRSRMYRTTVEVNGARDWINSMRHQNKRWMATVSFSSAHTPYQQPPTSLLPSASVDTTSADCTEITNQRLISNQMIDAMDTEIGRLLVETGLATRHHSGHLEYHPESTNTMVIIVGDNGSLGTDTKTPFDPSRAKGTSYQTGVWVPLIIAGPLVNSPNRIVSSMVNIADLFQLFSEIAGIEAHKKVPRTIDSYPLLPYLTNPNQESIRTSNFTQSGVNITANGERNGPCTIGTTCTQIPTSKSVCEDNGGIWWGAGADDPITAGIPSEGLKLCCDVNEFRYSQSLSVFVVLPETSTAIRNVQYKLVQNSARDYNPSTDACEVTTNTEFYEINENLPIPKLDREGSELPLANLTLDQQANFDALSAELNTILNSNTACPGDGNLDFVVDQKDIRDWSDFASQWGLSSVYDFNFDGLTDTNDRTIIEQNLGTKCLNH